MIKKKLIGLMMFLFLILPGSYASNGNIIEAGLTPEDTFYFLDKWGEGINLFFTFDKEKKARKYLEYAEERSLELLEIRDKMDSKELISQIEKNLRKAINGNNILKNEDTFKKINEGETFTQVKKRFPEIEEKFISLTTVTENVIKPNKKVLLKDKTYRKIEIENVDYDKIANELFEKFDGQKFKIIVIAKNDTQTTYFFHSLKFRTTITSFLT